MPKEQILNSKRPVEAVDIATGNVAHKKALAVQKSSQSGSTIPRSQPRTCTHPPPSHPAVEKSIPFSF